MIRVLFDNVEINGNYIQNITQTVQPYTQNFLLGSTICRQFDIDIRNEGFNSIPNFVYLYEDNDSDTQSNWTKYATLLVDSSELSNQNYTTFHLTDMMVRLNTELEYTLNDSILTIVQAICTKHNISLVNQSFYMSDFLLTWQEDILERDLIGYIAEVNGGYAYINENGNLVIAQYERIPADTVDINKCSSYLVGEHHLIDRVYVDFAIASQSFPEESENDTVYLNPANFLITDSQSYTVEKTLRHIHSIIKGFEFYNIEIEQCPINPNIKTGQLIGAGNWGYLTTDDNKYIITKTGEKILISDGLVLPFICTIDWKYNTMWMGGYKTDLECKIQEETAIATTQEKLYKLNFIVDREAGRIAQIVSDAEGHTGLFEIYLNSAEPNNVISVINAAADNIILNTKSLIFGEYPDRQYIEVSNLYDGSEATGILFNGTGNIIFEPQELFRVRNVTANDDIINSFSMHDSGSLNQSYVGINNYDKNNNYIQANFIELDSTYYVTTIPDEKYNRIILRNNATATGTSYQANNMIFRGKESENDTYISNFQPQSNYYANQFYMRSYNINDSKGNTFNIFNYKLGSGDVANNITASVLENSYNITLTNKYYVNTNYTGSQIALSSNQYTNDIYLYNFDKGSNNYANMIKLTDTSNGDNELYIDNYLNGAIANRIWFASTNTNHYLYINNYDSNNNIINSLNFYDDGRFALTSKIGSPYTLAIKTVYDTNNSNLKYLFIGNANVLSQRYGYANGSIIIDSTNMTNAGVYINGHKLVFSTINGTKYVTWS